MWMMFVSVLWGIPGSYHGVNSWCGWKPWPIYRLVGRLEHLYFFIQLGIMIPTDEVIFFRGVGEKPPTSRWLTSRRRWFSTFISHPLQESYLTLSVVSIPTARPLEVGKSSVTKVLAEYLDMNYLEEHQWGTTPTSFMMFYGKVGNNYPVDRPGGEISFQQNLRISCKNSMNELISY